MKLNMPENQPRIVFQVYVKQDLLDAFTKAVGDKKRGRVVEALMQYYIDHADEA